jgi:hypothetical protein
MNTSGALRKGTSSLVPSGGSPSLRGLQPLRRDGGANEHDPAAKAGIRLRSFWHE